MRASTGILTPLLFLLLLLAPAAHMTNRPTDPTIGKQTHVCAQEKYTLDSLNEIKGSLDEQFKWSRPEDGREVWGSKLQYFLAITR